MKTFESQLLELLREYQLCKINEVKYNFNLYNFFQWLSKRVEEKEVKTKREALNDICKEFERSGFFAIQSSKIDEFIDRILDL